MTETHTPPGRCRICQGGLRDTQSLREVMFGTGERFDYATCQDCGTLQIEKIPEDMGPYYPDNYYSFGSGAEPGAVRRAVKRLIFAMGWRRPDSWAGRQIRRALPFWLFQLSNVHSNSRFLDVGTGKGALLRQLAGWGFRHLEGVDPYIDADVSTPSMKIHRAEVAELQGTYDVVMMHHSLEHVEDPLKLLRDAKSRVRPGGALVVRIPVKGGYFWSTYGTDWVQIDPPRHFVLFTLESFRQLAEKAGLVVDKIFFDAHAFSFWGSELVKRGMTIQEEHFFSPEEMQQFTASIDELNARGESDSAGFILSVA